MKPSPCLLLLVFAMSVTLCLAQGSSPQPASEVPKAPLAGTAANVPQSNPPPAGSQPGLNSLNGKTSLSEGVEVEPIVSIPASSGNLAEPPQPKTEILDSSATGSGLGSDGHDPILDPPPLPNGMTTLVGGTVIGIDHVRNRMTITVFGGNRWKIAFDERTHIFLNGAETTELAIRKGVRVYVDTMLDTKKHDVFARNVHIGVAAAAADADGQVVECDQARGAITLRDQINSVPVHFTVDANTRIVFGTKPVSLGELKPGSLVHVKFSPLQPNRGMAREIVVVAAPGSAFIYVGKITYLDMHRGLLALEDTLDQKSYEIHFDPAHGQFRNDLAVGSEVRIEAVFEENRYNARSITLTKSAQAAEP